MRDPGRIHVSVRRLLISRTAHVAQRRVLKLLLKIAAAFRAKAVSVYTSSYRNVGCPFKLAYRPLCALLSCPSASSLKGERLSSFPEMDPSQYRTHLRASLRCPFMPLIAPPNSVFPSIPSTPTLGSLIPSRVKINGKRRLAVGRPQTEYWLSAAIPHPASAIYYARRNFRP